MLPKSASSSFPAKDSCRTFDTSELREKRYAAFSLSQVLAWEQGEVATKSGRLLLPPIQRSLVWRNAQIVNFWDSLLRGYPAGLMMVHQSQRGRAARTADGVTLEAGGGDFQLFDGQQRLSALILGCGRGLLSHRLRLWVDIGVAPRPETDLLFQLRITSAGQPFGYNPSAPNEKLPLPKRQAAADRWPDAKFNEISGNQLLEAVHPVPLADILMGRSIEIPSEHAAQLEQLNQCLERVSQSVVLFQLVEEEIVADSASYTRFFARLGTGGTPLSEEQLTYSLMKHQKPHLADRVQKVISPGGPGRWCSEVHLVLGTLRVAKSRATWTAQKDWQYHCEPWPQQVAQLSEPEMEPVVKEFDLWMPQDKDGWLLERLSQLRTCLIYQPNDVPLGLPPLLLAQFPRQLIHVLLLLSSDAAGYPNADLISFSLFWLLFVTDNHKAALHVFESSRKEQHSIAQMIRALQTRGHALRLPQMEQAREEWMGSPGPRLRTWEKRFSALGESAPAMKHLFHNGNAIRRYLTWLQRDYLHREFPSFDPTSTRDDDLPVDLDHLIPQSRFGFNWKGHRQFVELGDGEDHFYHHRHIIGNSLGNYHWLGTSANRERGAGKLVLTGDDLVDSPAEWDALIASRPWEEGQVEEFQRLIDLRSLRLLEELMTTSGLGTPAFSAQP